MVPPERSVSRCPSAPFMLALAGGLSLMAPRDGTGTARPGTCRRGWPERASALARTISGSRGSGGRASRQGRSRRALGLWIRVCFTVISLASRHVRARRLGVPAVFGWTVPEDGMSRGRPGASPEGGHAGGIFRSAAPGTTMSLGRPAGTAVPPEGRLLSGVAEETGSLRPPVGDQGLGGGQLQFELVVMVAGTFGEHARGPADQGWSGCTRLRRPEPGRAVSSRPRRCGHWLWLPAARRPAWWTSWPGAHPRLPAGLCPSVRRRGSAGGRAAGPTGRGPEDSTGRRARRVSTLSGPALAVFGQEPARPGLLPTRHGSAGTGRAADRPGVGDPSTASGAHAQPADRPRAGGQPRYGQKARQPPAG